MGTVFRFLGGTVHRMVLPHLFLLSDQATDIPAGFTHGCGKSGEILIIFGKDVIDTQHLPAKWRGDALGVMLAEIPTMGFCGRCQRTYDGS